MPGSDPGGAGSIPAPAALREPDQPLRGRLTAGWDALNVLVLVRFQPPQLKKRTEVIRLDEEPVSKTGGDLIACGFESHGFRSWQWAHGPTGRPQLRTLIIRVQLPVSPLTQSRGPTATTLGSHP